MHTENNINFSVRLRKVLLLVLFLSIISLPLLEYVLHISSEYENTENRTKAPLPSFDLTHLEPFPTAFDAYYNDNHNFRGDLLYLNSQFKFNMLNISPVKDVVEGKDHWMFRTKYIEPYINQHLFTNIELDSFNYIFRQRSAWLKQQDIQQYVVIVPNKSQIYPEYLPDGFSKKNRTTKTEQFMEALKDIPNLHVLYLKDALVAHKKDYYDLYYKTDQHWNEYGALVGMQAIVDEIRKTFPQAKPINLQDFNTDTTHINGLGLAKTLMLHETIKEVKLKVRSNNKRLSKQIDTTKYIPPEAFPYKNAYQLFFYQADSSLPKALIIRDSFTNAMAYKLPESFSQTTLIWDTWCYELNEDIVLEEKPDLLITIVIESNLPYIIYKHPYARPDGVDVIAID